MKRKLISSGKKKRSLDFLELAEDDQSSDVATRELLEEIDRSLKDYEKAAKTHAWLGEQGVNADVQLFAEADSARLLGEKTGPIQLASFVTDAVLLDGGNVTGPDLDGITIMQLPSSWLYGMDDLPGYDSMNRTLRVTTDMNLTQDAAGNSVGYLGRAHPLVRRALERVRRISYGGSASSSQDPRASVVAGNVAGPTLLCTFLGRVMSKAGREFERVLAATVSASGSVTFFANAEDWLPLADTTKARRTTDVFTRLYASWYADATPKAEQIVKDSFIPLANAFVREWQLHLDDERRQHEAWLQQRSLEITGEGNAPDSQLGLFGDTGSQALRPQNAWRGVSDPSERLAAFAADPSVHSRLRNEADGVLRL